MSKWSRNNMQRSSREQKDLIGDSHNSHIAQVKIFDTVTEIFKDRIDSAVIRLILEESEWKEETAIEKLIQIASTVEPSFIYNTKPQVDLAIIACSLLEDEKVDGSGADEVAQPLRNIVMDNNKEVSGSGTFCTFDPEAMATAEQSVLAMYDDILLKSSIFSSSSQEEPGPKLFSHENSTEIPLNEMCCNSDLLSDSGKNKTYFSQEYSQGGFDSSENTSHKRTKIFNNAHCPETQNTCASVGLTDKDFSPFSSQKLTSVSTSSDSDESTCSTDSSFVEELELPTQNKDSTFGGQVSLSLPLNIDTSRDTVSHESTFPTAEKVKTKFSDDVLECVRPTIDKTTSLTVGTRQEDSDLKDFLKEVSENRKEGIMASENKPIEDAAANTFLSAEAPEFIPAFASSSSSMFSNIHLIPVAECFHPSYIPVQYSRYPPRIIQEQPYAQATQNTANVYSQVSSGNVALKNLVDRNVHQVPLSYTAAAKSSGHRVFGNTTSKAQPPKFDVPPSGEFERVKQLVQHGGKLMVIMRGLPGSGKSHLARQIQGNGHVFSTDDYFLQNGVYHYSQEILPEAHAWNKKRVKDALDQGVTPIIVDNTNMMIWELLPYAQLANARGYEVEILEPSTPWKWQPKRLAKYNCHGVSIEAIKKMKDRFEVLDTSGLKALLKSTKRDLDVPSPKLPVAHSCLEKDKPENPRWSSRSQLQEYLQSLQLENSDSSHASNMLEMRKPSKKKKRTREHQGETLKAWEYIHDLVKRGATDEEIDNIIYISQFTDAEKQEVQRQRKNLKGLAGVKNTDEQSVNDGKTDEPLVRRQDSVSTSTENRSIMEAVDKVRNKRNQLFHTKSTIINPEKAAETKDSSSLLLEPTWEDPKPQRRSRVLREQRVSETEKSMENNIPDDEKAAIISECATTPIPTTSDIIDIIDVSPFKPQRQENDHGTIYDMAGVINTAPFRTTPTDHTMLEESSNGDVRKSEDKSDIAEASTGAEDSASEVSHIDNMGTEPQASENDTVSNDMEKFASSCHDKTNEVGLRRFSEVTDTLISDSRRFSQALEGQDAGTESNHVPPPDSHRKKTRRKKHRMPPKPFLDESIKQQFNIESWKAFIPENQITEGEQVENESSSGDFSLQKTQVHDASSQTEVKDFSMLFMVETSMPYNAPPLEEGYRCLCGKGWFISSGSADTMTASSSRLKLMLDKGTGVDNALVQVEPNLEILQSCFPEVAAGHLHEVLEVCQGDIEWATNLILDWGVSTPFTINDKHQLRQEMDRHHKMSAVVSGTPSPAMLGGARKPIQPASLFELCQGQLTEAGSTMIKDYLQCRVISSGYQRLQRIQSLEQERAKNISWGEHSILESLDKFSVPNKVLELPGLTAIRTPEETVKAVSAIPNLEQKRIKDLAEEVFSLSSSQSSSKSGSLDDLQAAGVDFKSSPLAQKALDTVDISSSRGLPSRGVQTVSCIDAEEDLTITVSHGVIKNLEQLFGPLPVPHDGNSVTVVVDPSTAQHLHSWLALSLQQRTPEEFSRIQQLREDEALAQKLQSLEETRVTFSQPASTNQPRKPPKKSASRTMSAKQSSSAPVNLLDIMEEEMARQEMRESMLKQLEASGNHLAIATKLKREKLYKHFPGIDESFLEEIFQANSYCLETTVSVIEGAHGHKQPVSTRLNMSAASSKNLDADSEQQEDLEIVKQQSIFDLVNTAWNGDPNQQPGAPNSEEFDYHALRQESYVHHRMRSECFEKAQEAYRRGMREVAIFYSQEGHRHTQLMQDANMRASQKILDARKLRLDQEMVLDLHGLHTDEAVAALKQVIAEKEKEFQQKPVHNRQFLYVITGRGKHSYNGVSRLRPAVTEYLFSSGHRFVGVQPGMLKVTLYSAY